MENHRTRREFLREGTGLIAAGLSAPALGAEPPAVCTLENRHVKFSIGPDGRNLEFIDKRDGKDYAARDADATFARVKKAGKYYNASTATFADGKLAVAFGDSGARAVIKAMTCPEHFVFEVLSCDGEQVEELVLVDIPLLLQGAPQEPLSACALALNLQTNVSQLPRPSSRLRAMCYGQFGFAGAKVALVACPAGELRRIMQQVVSAAEDLPHSPIGGPWALGQAINQGSYLFNFGDMTAQKADDWIKLAKTLGMNQIDFHGGSSFRFGDCQPNPVTYPNGFASLKAVVDKLHAAGISAGLHTYAFFIARNCPWVTPVPDARLAKDATFTLSESLTADANAVPVVEPTKDMSTITGFFVRNSVTLRVDDELITYSGIAKEPPYAFTGCRRGAWGTRPSAHPKGAKVDHLKECFGLFVPDPDSTLFTEVAGKTAEAFNTCGFDMMYLDALDGSDILGGPQNSWHYGSKYVFELWKRLDKPALMEMSTFHHHLWYVRSRYAAWDHPNRSHKKFIDIHCAANEESRRMFLPGELGWWALKSWSGPQSEPTFSDDIEYLMAKCLGTDTGMAMMGINPDNVSTIPALPRLADIIRRYEDLRHSGQVPDRIKAKLSVAGAEYRLIGSLRDGWHFQPVAYAKHRVEGIDGWSNLWSVQNELGRQPVKLRIEALMAAGPYDSPGNIVLADFEQDTDFPVRASAAGVTAAFQPSKAEVKAGTASGCFTASSAQATRSGTWTKAEKPFSPPVNLSAHQALGVWVHGDGKGEVLNFQLHSPPHLSHAIGDHYVIVDFAGWRYFELLEPEGQRYADYVWPYGGIYSIYRESVNFGHIQSLGLWYNNLPPKETVTCYVSPIKALPWVNVKLVNPAITIGGRTITFPVEIDSGCYLELNDTTDCKLYGPKGELLREITPRGEVPVLEPGVNHVKFESAAPSGVNPRAKVTVISYGEPLRA